MSRVLSVHLWQTRRRLYAPSHHSSAFNVIVVCRVWRVVGRAWGTFKQPAWLYLYLVSTQRACIRAYWAFSCICTDCVPTAEHNVERYMYVRKRITCCTYSTSSSMFCRRRRQWWWWWCDGVREKEVVNELLSLWPAIVRFSSPTRDYGLISIAFAHNAAYCLTHWQPSTVVLKARAPLYLACSFRLLMWSGCIIPSLLCKVSRSNL